ncbi:hypothetical protein BaRGS_00010285, partial [Batillaria attramentaria]
MFCGKSAINENVDHVALGLMTHTVPDQGGYGVFPHNPPPQGYTGHTQFPMFEQKIAHLAQGHKDT